MANANKKLKARDERALAELATLAGKITFPKLISERQSYDVCLERLIKDHFDSVGGRTVEFHYNEWAGTFSWRRIESCGSFGEACVSLNQSFEVDPAKPIAEEFARVLSEKEAFEEQVRKTRRMVVQNGGKGWAD